MSDKKEMLIRVSDLATRYLESQLTLATSSDQRAVVAAGIFIATSTAMLGALVGVATISKYSFHELYSLYVGGAVVSLAFGVGGYLCMTSAYPTEMYIPGDQPQSWFRDIEAQKSIEESIEEQLRNIQGEIEHNRKTLKRNASKFRTGVVVGMLAPVFGFIVWAVAFSAALVGVVG